MSWSRLTTLATDRAHCAAVHEALIERNASPRYRQMLIENRIYWNIKQRFEAEGLSESEAIKAARAKCEEWCVDQDHIEDQCGGCRFYITLEADLGADWGLCTRLEGEFFGTAMFEHDGCAQFEPDNLPLTPELTQHFEGMGECGQRQLEWARQEEKADPCA